VMTWGREKLANLLEGVAHLLVLLSLKALSLSFWIRRDRSPEWPRPVFDFLRVVMPALSKMTPYNPRSINRSDGGHAIILQWLYRGGSLERHDLGT
jgi:hypothetical protein